MRTPAPRELQHQAGDAHDAPKAGQIPTSDLVDVRHGLEVDGVGVGAGAPAHAVTFTLAHGSTAQAQVARGAHFLGDIFATSCFSEKRKPNISFWSCLTSEAATGRFHSR